LYEYARKRVIKPPDVCWKAGRLLLNFLDILPLISEKAEQPPSPIKSISQVWFYTELVKFTQTSRPFHPLIFTGGQKSTQSGLDFRPQ